MTDHGNKKALAGNKNAAKEETSESILHIRVTKKEKSLWTREANKKKIKLSQYVRDQLPKPK